MARKKTTTARQQTRRLLAERLKEIRVEMFGEHGGPLVAHRLGIPGRTWYNYETGVTVPAEVLLHFLELTAVEPTWLLQGRGEKYRNQRTGAVDEHPGGEGSRSVVEILNQISERLQEGQLVINVSWKKSD